MVYPFVASIEKGPDVTSDVTVTKGLVGNTWQGLQLSITQGDTTVTQAGGKPLTVTSPNTLEGDGFNVVSEDFCLGYGSWTVRMGAPTHAEMASYNESAHLSFTMEERRAIGAPINTVPIIPQAVVNWALKTLNVDVNNFGGNGVYTPGTARGVYTPFSIRWAIFPAEMRAEAEVAAATGAFGQRFIGDHFLKRWAVGEVDYEKENVVPFVRNNGEQACEGHGYGKASCEAVGCCQYAECSIGDSSGECHSAVGRRQCTDVEFVSHDEDCS
eukprot:scaffold48112_cov62-Phaeocystis_antarctica.AAC.2